MCGFSVPRRLKLRALELAFLITWCSWQQVMTKPKNALMKQYKFQFSLDDVGFHITDEALRAVAQTAIKKNTGARGLRSIMDSLLLEVDHPPPGDLPIFVLSYDAPTPMHRCPGRLFFVRVYMLRAVVDAVAIRSPTIPFAVYPT